MNIFILKSKDKKKCLRCCNYFHHFLLLEVIEPEEEEQNAEQNGKKEKIETPENISKDKNRIIKVMVAHYTSSKEIFTNNSKFGIGKFISQTIKIFENKKEPQNELFDLDSGLFLVSSTVKDQHSIRERLYKRLGERMYDFGANNCEHAVSYILTGKSESKESKSRPRCADLVSAAFGELKEFGLKVAMMIALVSSLAGSLTRYSYVRLLIAGVAAERSDIGVNETCSNLLGDNIILEAKVVLDKHSEIPRFSEITSSEDIISDIKASLNNPFLCEIAELLAIEAITKTFWLSVCMSVSVETMFLIKRIIFVYIPLFEIQIKKDFFRMILVRLVAGYLSIPIGILGGSVGQAYLSPPALYFFIFAFFASLITRYILTIVASIMFDCLYCCFCECFCGSCYTCFFDRCKELCCDCCCNYCCLDIDQYKNEKDVENGCSLSCCCVFETDIKKLNTNDCCNQRDDTPYCNGPNVKQRVCYSAAVLCYSLCIAGIIVALYYFLD